MSLKTRRVGGAGDLNGSAPKLKPNFATLRLRKCGVHCPGRHPICPVPLWVVRCLCCTWCTAGARAGARNARCAPTPRGEPLAGRAACRLSPRARARAARPAPWPRPAPACPARIGAAGCRSPRSGEGAPPAALLQQRAARCWCDPGFPGCLGVRRRQRTSTTPRRRQQGRQEPRRRR